MRLKLAFSILTILGASAAHAQNISVGFPSFDGSMNILTSQHPAAAFIRSATLDTLVKLNDGREQLGAVGSMSAGPDGKVLSFRPAANATFSSGKEVLGSDIAYSLNRCLALKNLEGVSSVAERQRLFRGKTMSTIEVTLEHPIKPGAQAAPPSLAACPIVEERSSVLFGAELGRGGSLLASGDYKVTAFSGKEYTLTKINDRLRESAASFTVRGLEDSARALTALRAGTLDAMLTTSATEIEKAKADPTLSLSECLHYTVIKRHDLQFPCNPSLSPEAIKYSATS